MLIVLPHHWVIQKFYQHHVNFRIDDIEDVSATAATFPIMLAGAEPRTWMSYGRLSDESDIAPPTSRVSPTRRRLEKQGCPA